MGDKKNSKSQKMPITTSATTKVPASSEDDEYWRLTDSDEQGSESATENNKTITSQKE